MVIYRLYDLLELEILDSCYCSYVSFECAENEFKIIQITMIRVLIIINNKVL